MKKIKRTFGRTFIECGARVMLCAAVFMSASGFSYAQETVGSANADASSPLEQQEGADDEDYDDIMEGEGLTLESKSDPAKEAVSGVSVVMTKEEMQTTSQIGLVEDVMSSVSTMPGVSYSGGWESEPSIRGGYPREMTTVLDGVYLLFPWHWGCAYSIFNPHMVDTVKMSNGVFSSRYGRALSGLMEVTTVQPEPGEFHIDLNITTIATDMFAQIPLGKKAGLFVGGKCTYMEGYIGAFRALTTSDATDMIKKVPYIRDFFAKAYFNPTDELSFTLSGFFGSDGISLSTDETDDGFRETSDFDYDIYQGFTSLNMKWLVTDDVQIHALASYNFLVEDLKMETSAEGEQKYNDDFIAQYGHLLDENSRAAKKYYLQKQTDYMSEKITDHMFQGKLESDIQIPGGSTIAFGAEEVMSRSDVDDKMDMWIEQNISGNPYPDFRRTEAGISSRGTNCLNSAGFLLWNFGGSTSVLSGEIGARVDHLYIWNSDDWFDLNTKPVFNPRASIQFTPWRNKGIFEKATFSAGSGIFSSVPLEMMMVEKKMNVDEDDVAPNRAVFAVLGTEVQLDGGWNCKLEGYYKHYLTRLYIVTDDRNPVDVKYIAKSDGEGYAYGFDFMLEKKAGGFADGYISYSFVNARYKNPFAPLYDGQTSTYDDPLDEWYYPSFHRFNTLNIVANLHPTSHWTFTIKGTLATGTPKKDEGDIYCYPVKLDDGTVIQRYTRSSFYSDTLRTQISCPVDIRIGYKNKLGKTRGTWEWYVGAEDIFLNLYTPEGSRQFDRRTGEMSDQKTSADFNIGIPMISTGCKFSF